MDRSKEDPCKSVDDNFIIKVNYKFVATLGSQAQCTGREQLVGKTVLKQIKCLSDAASPSVTKAITHNQ